MPFMFSGHKPIMVFGEPSIDLPKNSYFVDAISGDLDYSQFISKIFDETDVFSKISDIIKQQNVLFVNSFQTAKGFEKLFNIPEVKPFNLSIEETNLLNKKTFQYSFLDGAVPLPKFKIASSKNPLKYFNDLKSSKGVFTSLDDVLGGTGTKIHKSEDSLNEYFNNQKSQFDFLMVEALDLDYCPCVDVIIANKNEIYQFGLLDQIMDGLYAQGTVYPSKADFRIRSQIFDITHVVAEKIADMGISGYVSFDYLVDKSGNLYFGEINPRFSASSNERMLMMDSVRPPNSPTIMDLAFMASYEKSFNGHPLWVEPQNMCWIKSELTAESDSIVMKNYSNTDEFSLFKNTSSDWSLVGQRPEGTIVKKDDSVAKYVAVFSDISNVDVITNHFNQIRKSFFNHTKR